ncbi:MAG: hypothetical protein FWG87_07875 [Defluviitaleaceae bacterium]|nr:hypothetical protein [Defluviitaleaceae bacterium]
MKKYLVLLFTLLIATACTSSGHDEALVGHWLWRGDGAYWLFFYEDGTGTRGYAIDPEAATPQQEMTTFTWETQGDRLSMNRDIRVNGVIKNEAWTYEIHDGILYIASRNAEGVQYSYAINNFDSVDLAGVWAWTENPAYTYVFHAEGKGTRGTDGQREDITWSANSSQLNVLRRLDDTPQGARRGEMWELDLDGDMLTITLLDVNEGEGAEEVESGEVVRYTYTRVG